MELNKHIGAQESQGESREVFSWEDYDCNDNDHNFDDNTEIILNPEKLIFQRFATDVWTPDSGGFHIKAFGQFKMGEKQTELNCG